MCVYVGGRIYYNCASLAAIPFICIYPSPLELVINLIDSGRTISQEGGEQVQYIKVVAAAVSGEKAIGESWEKKEELVHFIRYIDSLPVMVVLLYTIGSFNIWPTCQEKHTHTRTHTQIEDVEEGRQILHTCCPMFPFWVVNERSALRLGLATATVCRRRQPSFNGLQSP